MSGIAFELDRRAGSRVDPAPVSIGQIIECAAEAAATEDDPQGAALARADEAVAKGDTRTAQVWTSAAFILARGFH